MGGLDTWQWLIMQSDAALGFEVAETLPVTGWEEAPDYPWDHSDERTQCDRCASCISLRDCEVTRHVANMSDNAMLIRCLISVVSVRRHITHVEKIINLGGEGIEWVNAAQDYPEFLSHQTLGYNITATTDILAAERSAINAGMPQKAMRLLMDIRKTIARSDVDQAQARLLLSNLHSPKSRPVVVSTKAGSSLAMLSHTCTSLL